MASVAIGYEAVSGSAMSTLTARARAEQLAVRIKHRGDQDELFLNEAADAILAYADEVRREERARLKPAVDEYLRLLHAGEPMSSDNYVIAQGRVLTLACKMANEPAKGTEE